MNDIKDIPTIVLEEELARRKELPSSLPPQELAVKDWTGVLKLCRGYIIDLHNNHYADEDYPDYIFETAMNAIYGDDIWKWINGVKR